MRRQRRLSRLCLVIPLLVSLVVCKVFVFWCFSSNDKHDYHSGQSKLPAWVQPFTREPFLAFQRDIDQRIAQRRREETSTNTTTRAVVDFSLYTGEFGYELAAMIPWAYHVSRLVPVTTKGVPGTKYLYYFSQQHDMVNVSRKALELPPGNPFGRGHPHARDSRFPTHNWTMPPWNILYKRSNVQLNKPLLMIFNKYTAEWEEKVPVNFISVETLKDVLSHFYKTHHIVYVRLEHKALEDDQESFVFGDKAMIRQDFSNHVVVLDDLMVGLDPDAVNLLQFSLGALASRFISVQGGVAVVASLFGGKNVILVKQGYELDFGDYTYYHRFANTTVTVARNESSLLDTVKRELEK